MPWKQSPSQVRSGQKKQKKKKKHGRQRWEKVHGEMKRWHVLLCLFSRAWSSGYGFLPLFCFAFSHWQNYFASFRDFSPRGPRHRRDRTKAGRTSLAKPLLRLNWPFPIRNRLSAACGLMDRHRVFLNLVQRDNMVVGDARTSLLCHNRPIA